MENFDPRIAMMFISTGLRVLSARVLVVIGMVMMFMLAGAAMWDPTYIRLGTVAVFGVIVFWPICKIDRGTAKDRAIVSPGD